jgi:hypothetical protein
MINYLNWGGLQPNSHSLVASGNSLRECVIWVLLDHAHAGVLHQFSTEINMLTENQKVPERSPKSKIASPHTHTKKKKKKKSLKLQALLKYLINNH